MNKHVKGVGLTLIAASIFMVAWITAPGPTNNCTPRLIEKYTMDIISHDDCLALPRCVVAPKDVRHYNYAKLNFNQCVAQVLSDVKKEKETEE